MTQLFSHGVREVGKDVIHRSGTRRSF